MDSATLIVDQTHPVLARGELCCKKKISLLNFNGFLYNAKYFGNLSRSTLQLVVMLVAGIVQVVLVRSIFDDKSAIHKIWK